MQMLIVTKIQIETRMNCSFPSPPSDWRNQKLYGGKGTVDKNVNWSTFSGGWSGNIYQKILWKAFGKPWKVIYEYMH